MAHIESIDYAERQTTESTIVSSLKSAWSRYIRARAERHIIVSLSRLDRHLLEDMGLNPDSIYKALDGGWDEVRRAEFPRV